MMIRSFVIQPNEKKLIASLALLVAAAVTHQYCPDFMLFSRDLERNTKNSKNDNIEEETQNGTANGDGDNNNSSSSVNIDEYSDAKETVGDSPYIARFPWEPNYEPPNGRNTKNSTKPGNASLKSHGIAPPPFATVFASSSSKQSCKRELEFLSTMTFVNGGLRSPSCPCCI